MRDEAVRVDTVANATSVILGVQTFERLIGHRSGADLSPTAERILRDLQAEFDDRIATMRRTDGLSAAVGNPPDQGEGRTDPF